jgi:hypothetical protein
MSRQKKAGTISALLIGLLTLVVSLSTAGTHASAIVLLQRATVTSTPTPCQDNPDDCADYATDDALNAAADVTDTAAAITRSALTATATSTVGVGTPTDTPTANLSPTSFSGVTTPAASPIQPTPIVVPQELAPTEPPTAIPDSALTCFPGQPLVITGGGPPHAAFLLYFGQRVVSGGSVTASGRFATTLIVGYERAGVYPVTVRVRGTTQVLVGLSCAVPDVTPTYVPRARALP